MNSYFHLEGDVRSTKFFKSDGTLIWESQPGPQSYAFLRSRGNPAKKDYGCNEILIGGARGGGKSDWLLMWVAEPAHIAGYRGLIARKSQKALRPMIDRAKVLYSQMGAEFNKTDSTFIFPCGALVTFTHLKDDRSVEDVKGHEWHRIGIEELTQIEEPRWYAELRATNRCTVAALKPFCPKMASTTNPDGPGHQWVMERFVAVKGVDGEIIPWQTPIYDRDSKRTIIFIPAKLEDNKILMDADPNYEGSIDNESLPDDIRRAWRHGEWDFLGSTYFPSFRAKPLPGDPPHRTHVVQPMDIPKWCNRWISLDWGHHHHTAVYWGAGAPDKRLHVYREYVVNKTPAREVGAEIARRSYEELTHPDFEGHTMTLYVSHEITSQRGFSDGITVGSELAAGIESVLGQGSATWLQFNEQEKALERAGHRFEAHKTFTDRVKAGSSAPNAPSIMLRIAYTDRIAGANYIRSLLRMDPMSIKATPDEAWEEHLSKQYGEDAALSYRKMFEGQAMEVTPGVQIHSHCKHLIKCLPRLQSDPKRPEDCLKFHGNGDEPGDDPYDAFRYLLAGHQSIESKVPYPVWFSSQMHLSALANPELEHDINLRIQVAEGMRERYDKLNRFDSIPYSIQRGFEAADPAFQQYIQ